MSGTDSRVMASCRPSSALTTSSMPSPRTLPKVGAALIGGAVCIGVVGCAAIAPVEISMLDGNLAVAFCDDLSLTNLSIHQSVEADRSDDWSTEIVSQDSSVAVSEGEPHSVGAGFFDIEDPDNVVNHAGVSFLVEFTVAGESSSYATILEVPEDGLSEGTWVRSDRSTRTDPCGVRQ
jgi:hypothetical protein